MIAPTRLQPAPLACNLATPHLQQMSECGDHVSRPTVSPMVCALVLDYDPIMRALVGRTLCGEASSSVERNDTTVIEPRRTCVTVM